jgi:hypothetical protein
MEPRDVPKISGETDLMADWIFEPQRGPKRGPQEAELFKSEQTAEGEYAGNDALVREILQNAIDARQHPEPLRVRLAIHEAHDAPDQERLSQYFRRLREPLALRGITSTLSDVPDIPCRYLVCEDFGTRGLEGDFLLNRDPLPSETGRQDFYWFWRNIGRSGKTGEDLGRWGLGKTVYRAASKTGCMFGLTVRNSDRKRLLMGQAVLQIHHHEGCEFAPEGYWSDSVDEDGFALPVTCDEQIAQFSKEWKLTRVLEPGLSVVAPFIHPDIRASRLLEAIAVNFFLRIVRGELVVEVAGADLPYVRLDSQTIEEWCETTEWNGPKRMKRHTAPPITFIRRCLQVQDLQPTEILGKERMPEFSQDAFPEETLHQLRREFAAGELIAVKTRVWLPKNRETGQEGQIGVYLKRTKDGGTCDSYYVREGMTITKITSSASRRGIQSLVLVEPGPMAELLGDTEGPSHEDWLTSAERPDRTWKQWKGRVKFARRIVDNLVELLTPPATEPDFDLLSNFFAVDQFASPQRRPKPGTEVKARPTFENIQSKPKWYYVQSRGGGFLVARNKEVEMPQGAQLQVAAAYDLPSGDPLRNWSPLDFEFTLNGRKGIQPHGQGLKPERVEGNTMLLSITEPDFKLLVEGFDQYRDVFVRIDEVSEAGEESES